MRTRTTILHNGKTVNIANFKFENGIASGRIHGHEMKCTLVGNYTNGKAKHALIETCYEKYGHEVCDKKTAASVSAVIRSKKREGTIGVRHNGKDYTIMEFKYSDEDKTAIGRIGGKTYKVTGNNLYEAKHNLVEAKLNDDIDMPLYKSKKLDDGSIEVNGIVNGKEIQLYYTGIAVNEYNETSDGKPFCAKIREDLERKYNEIMNGGENMNNEIEMKVDDQFIKAFVEAGCTAVGKELKCKGYILDLNDKTITEALKMINEAIDKYEERKAEINKMISATLARLSA